MLSQDEQKKFFNLKPSLRTLLTLIYSSYSLEYGIMYLQLNEYTSRRDNPLLKMLVFKKNNNLLPLGRSCSQMMQSLSFKSSPQLDTVKFHY